MKISIHQDRVSISLNENLNIQLVVWDLEKNQHKDLEKQINLITSISSKIDDWVKHLKINGYDASLEDIN